MDDKINTAPEEETPEQKRAKLVQQVMTSCSLDRNTAYVPAQYLSEIAMPGVERPVDPKDIG